MVNNIQKEMEGQALEAERAESAADFFNIMPRPKAMKSQRSFSRSSATSLAQDVSSLEMIKGVPSLMPRWRRMRSQGMGGLEVEELEWKGSTIGCFAWEIKEVGLLNANGYFKSLLSFIDKGVEEGLPNFGLEVG
ncbi:hypothetical protein Tco_0805946, partial [Tanacetum coccineum]